MPACTSELSLVIAADRLLGAQSSATAAAGHHAFLDRGAGRVEGVPLRGSFFSFYFHFRRATDADHRDGAGRELGPGVSCSFSRS